jgi:NADH-quinone oxidoreductase subunit G
MRVWFLKETKTIDVNDGLGCNITIGSREGRIYRITPRENNEVNSNWIPDSHRLNFKYLHDAARLTSPLIAGKPSTWDESIPHAVNALKAARNLAMVVSARLTNEELYLAKTLAQTLGIALWDVLPRTGEPDGILIPADRNPNTSGARALGLTCDQPGSQLQKIAEGIKDGSIRGVLSIGEDLTSLGLSAQDLAKLEALVVTDILPNKTTAAASVVLPASGWAEKRGSMINIKGRLQRLNKAVDAPSGARDDWEILKDLATASGATLAMHSIEDVFRAMSQDTPIFAGLNLSKIGDLGLQLAAPPPAPASAKASV